MQGCNHVFKVGGSNFLVYGITTLLQKKLRQVYPVWCSRLHNHTLFIKKLCQKLGGPDPRPPQWLHPCLDGILEWRCSLVNGTVTRSLVQFSPVILYLNVLACLKTQRKIVWSYVIQVSQKSLAIFCSILQRT